MKLSISLIVSTVALATSSYAQEGPSPFGEPSTKYLTEFRETHKKIFVLERYDAGGKLYGRDVEEITKPIEITDGTRRTINGKEYVLRGLDSCPSQKVIYNAQQTWDCKDAAKDYAGAVYNDRASVVLCKTLVLTPTPGTPDPVSCYALVGTATSLDSYAVSNDDDSMVFQGLASIGLTKDGKPLRPDLLKSAVMGKQIGLGNAGQ